MAKTKKKYYIIGGILLILVIVGLLLINFNKSIDVELEVDSLTYMHANLHKGDTLRKIDPPTKEGYTFEGWYVNGEEFDLDTPIKENIKLEARFSKNVYTFTIDPDNGDEEEVLKVEYEDTVEEPKKPSKKGYIFQGWYVGDEEYDFNTKIINNTSIIAKWTKITTASYKVEHYIMNLDGTYSDKPNETETYKGKIGSTINPDVKSYTGFTSPVVQTVKILADDKLIVKYYYERNKYSLDIVGDKGVEKTTGAGTYYYGTKVKIGYTIKDGYTFTSFNENLTDNTYTIGATDKTIKINSKANDNTKYTVEYYLMDLDGINYSLDKTDEFYGTTDTTVTPLAVDYEGFTTPNNESINIDGNGKAVVKYYYERNKYTISINKSGEAQEYLKLEYNGQKLQDNIEVYFGEEVSIIGSHLSILPVHFESLGEEWELNDGKAIYSFIMPAENIVTSITLNYNSYTVVYHGNGGNTNSGNDSYTQVLKTGITEFPSLIANEFNYDGYTFLGWSKNKDASVALYDVSDFQEDGTYDLTTNLAVEDGSTVDLYAIWQANKNTVTFKYNNGTNDNYKFYSRQDFDTLIERPEDPERAGYDFKGWFEDTDGINEWKFDSDKMPDEALTLYAKWEARTDTGYTVENYYMGTDGKYPSNPETTQLTGTTDALTGYQAQTKEGFKTPVLKESENGATLDITKVTINGDGTTVLKYYYERVKTKLTIEFNESHVTVTPMIQNKEYYYGEQVTITINAKPGYHFTKYNTEDEKVTTDTFTYTIGTSDKTIKIESVGYSFTVNYHNEEGNPTGTMTSDTFTFGNSYQLKSNTFTKEAYVLTITNYNGKDQNKTIDFANNFTHWLDKNNSKTYENNSDLSEYIPTKDNDTLDLYAVYTTETREITKPDNRDGYKFNGFKDGDKPISEEERVNYTISSSKTINADWSTINYNLKYGTYEGTCTNCTDSTYNIESGKITLPDLTREGYDFNGWIVNGSGTPVKELDPSKHLEATTLTTNNSSWTAHTYTVTYTDKAEHSATCTYDKDCILSDINSINIEYHDFIKKLDGNDTAKNYVSLPKVTECTLNDSDCKDSIQVNSNNKYYVKNLTAENNGKVTITLGDYTLPEASTRNDDYVFGGWSTTAPNENGPDIDYTLTNILGYKDLGEDATFVGEYTYDNETSDQITDNITLYAIWWERPYINSVEFVLKKSTPSDDTGEYIECGKSEVVLGRSTSKKTPLYVKIPKNKNFFVDIFSLTVGTDTTIRLNTKASHPNNFIDIYPSSSTKTIAPGEEETTYFVNLYSSMLSMTATMPFNYDVQTMKWHASAEGGNLSSFLNEKTLSQLLTGETFPVLFTTLFGTQPLAVADKFGCNGLACSYHYVSTYYQLNGDAYYFFSTEDDMTVDKLYTINYNINGETIYTIQVPEGTKIPDIGTIVNKYAMREEVDEEGNLYDITESYNVEWDYEFENAYAIGDQHIINIEGNGSENDISTPTVNNIAITNDKSKYLEEIKPVTSLVIN